MKTTIKVLTLCTILLTAAAPAISQTSAFHFERMLVGAAGIPFVSPDAVTIDNQGDIYVVDTGNGRLVKYNRSGDLVLTFGLVTAPSALQYYPYAPAVTVGSAGQIVVTVPGDRQLDVYDAGGSLLRTQTLPAVLVPLDAATDTTGALYVLSFSAGEEFTPFYLYKFDRDGNVVASTLVSGGLNRLTANALAVAPSGDVYVVEDQTTFPPGVQGIHKFDSNLKAEIGVISVPTLNIDRIAVDDAGHIYATETTQVQEFSPSGALLATFGSRGTAPSQFLNAAGIAVDAAGTIYVADTYNSRVGIYSAGADYTVFWQNGSTNDLVSWTMNGRFTQGTQTIAQGVSADWKVVASADLFGDGAPGLLWQSQSSGDVVYWPAADIASQTGDLLVSNVSPDWRLAAAIDLNGDGVPDFVWQSRSTGDVVYWLLAPASGRGIQVLSSGYLAQSVEQNYRLVGLTDLNEDGTPDLVWQDTVSGDVVYWLLNGTLQVASTGYLAQYLAPGWQLAAFADINGDGKPDLIWQNTDSDEVAYWLLSGTAVVGSGDLAQGVAPGWRIVAAQ